MDRFVYPPRVPVPAGPLYFWSVIGLILAASISLCWLAWMLLYVAGQELQCRMPLEWWRDTRGMAPDTARAAAPDETEKVNTMEHFGWFWLLLAGVTSVRLTLWWLSDLEPWRLRLNFTEVLIITPWGTIWIADEAFDPCYWRFFSGVEICRRNANPYDKVHRIFDRIFLYTAEERFL
jgi:hypothetical protein